MKELDAIENAINEAKQTIKFAEMLKRLKTNKDFKAVILEHYIKDYAAELVQAKSQIYNQDDKQQKFIDGQILAIGHFIQFMEMALTSGATAEAAIESHEEERLSLLDMETFN